MTDKMLSSVDFAKYLVLLSQRENITLNLTQLQKILYICDGSLLALGYNLINENCQVWDYGPVYPKVYKWYNKNNGKPVSESDISPALSLYLNEISVNDVIESAIKKFGKWTSGQLSEWSHQIGSPWDVTKKTKGMYSKIPKEIMKDYFSKILNLNARK